MMKHTFRGGIHPADRKLATAHKPILTAPVPPKLILPVRQHIGAPCVPVVQPGDFVKKGQLIADALAFVSAPIHAPTSGRIASIAEHHHPVFGACKAIVLESDGLDTWLEGIPAFRDWRTLQPQKIKEMIREAGIVGLGGATFPTHVKISPPPDKKVDTLILNGAECEPYLTSDHRVMLEMADKVMEGIQIVMTILNIKKAYIGIEENKPDAIKILTDKSAGTEIKVVPLPCKYPQGAEKTLVMAVLGREVPSGGLPADVGVVVQNTGTMVAVADAVIHGIPLIERVTTVTGSCIADPRNVLIRLGTSFEEAIQFCGGFTVEPAKIIMGGPMMGTAQRSLTVPVIKGTSGIVALSAQDVADGRQRACIRCGRCVEVCPMGLVPSMLSILGERKFFQAAKDEYDLLDCVECGSCVYICPAKRNIVHYVKMSKAQLTAAAGKK